jgi:hypothetical protein
MATTHAMLRDFFGIADVTVAPPRAAHPRFGGALHNFHTTASVDVLDPPFVTFAHYVIAAHDKVENAYDILPQSAGRLTNVSRPEHRTTPLATKTPTGASPLFLEFLASFKDKKRTRPEEEKPDIQTKNANTGNHGFLAKYRTGAK